MNRYLHVGLLLATILKEGYGIQVTFVNECQKTVELYDNANVENISPGGTTSRMIGNGFKGMYRDGRGDQATLAEIAVDPTGVWYDISIIPPSPGHCTGYDHCKAVTGKTGFNTPMQMTSLGGGKTLTCMSDGCTDAYLFPNDVKTNHAPAGTDLKVTFCPGGGGGQQTPEPTTPAPTPAPVEDVLAPVIQHDEEDDEAEQPETETPETEQEGKSGGESDEGDSSSSNEEDTPFAKVMIQMDEPSTFAPVTTKPALKPTEDLQTVEVSVQSSGSGSILPAFIGIVGVVGVVFAAIAVAVIRAKKKAIDEEPKSPRDNRAMSRIDALMALENGPTSSTAQGSLLLASTPKLSYSCVL